MYFWNDARPRLIWVSAAERLSSSRSGELVRVIAPSSKLSMCFSCPTMRRSGAPISRLADKIASAAMTSVSNPSAASRSFALRSIVGWNGRSDHPIVEVQRREGQEVVVAVFQGSEFDLTRGGERSEIHTAVAEILADGPQQVVVLAQGREARHLAVLLPIDRGGVRRGHDVAIAIEHDNGSGLADRD